MVRSDADLIDACLSSDQQAWHELVTRYSRLVYSIPRRKGFNADDADDVFQNVFTIVYRQLPNLRQYKSLPAWLITITQRQCIRLRKPGPAQVDLDETGLDNVAQTGDQVQLDQVQLWERQHVVQQALRELDPRCRELLTALFLDSSSDGYKAIAARIQIPIGSIGPIRARCFKKLEAILKAMGIDGLL